ncbi:MAG: BrnT family toxin [Planctomycetes bacterium]|nr:BrnT family toxin [Planctomycetota bacterium]
MKFEWDEEKAKTNVQKHKVTFDEAATVFGDFLSRTFPDPDHSLDEDRLITIGTSDRGRVLIVSHTDRDDRTRIISARKAKPQERKAYEEES